MRYTKREFACTSAAGGAEVPGQIAVSCTSGEYRLGFTFSRDRGVTEFQDFCDFDICTFRLEDREGLLSGAMTEFMGLRRIQRAGTWKARPPCSPRAATSIRPSLIICELASLLRQLR